MARSSWNRNSPDVVGIEFMGPGVASHVIQTETQHKGLSFRAQRTGEIDQIAVYSGALTFNPVLSAAHFAGHRVPFIVDLYPASGFDVGPLPIVDTFPCGITASSNVLNHAGNPPFGNELAQPNDGLFLVPNGSSPPSVTVEMGNAAAFPLDRHVLSPQIEFGSFRQMRVRRIDQNSTSLWNRVMGATTWAMGEAYIESGTTGPYRLWSPTDIRQFALTAGNRRLRCEGLDTQSNIIDMLRLRIHSIPERRVGVGILEIPGSSQWVTVSLHAPNATGTAASVVQGVEYILQFRAPGGFGDYGSSAKYDTRGVSDRRPNGGFVHFSDLNWNYHEVVMQGAQIHTALGDLIDGLPSVSLINNSSQTVDTQPYRDNVPALPHKSSNPNRLQQSLQVPAGATEYSGIKVNVSLILSAPNAPVDKKSIIVELINNSASLIAGPFNIDQALWESSPSAGTNIFNDPIRTVTVPFGSGIDINEVNGVIARFTLHPDYGEPGKTNNIWRVNCLYDDCNPVTGSDQTSAISATGFAFVPPTNALVQVNQPGISRGDLQVLLLSQAPEITGIGVTGLSQPVTGGVCDPCPPFTTPECAVRSIPYNRICWTRTALPQDKFGYYELQRQEMEMDWETIAIIAPTGTPITGAPVTGVANCFDDWSHVYDSEVCYRVRQQRVDGTLSDFVETACITTASPEGADIIITAPDDPSLNVAFPEAHESLPIQHQWTVLDASTHVVRAIYGRDKHIAFRPLETLGLRFQRRLLLSGLCTPHVPCLEVTHAIHDVCNAAVGYLVVRDRCGNRWYATVSTPTLTQIHEPILGDLWFADIEVTELATPIISVETV